MDRTADFSFPTGSSQDEEPVTAANSAVLGHLANLAQVARSGTAEGGVSRAACGRWP